jgi:ADP-ribose pyrophosphatase YjhB (NUDIX family)
MPRPVSRSGVPRGPREPVLEVSAGGVVVRTIGGQEHVLVIRDPYRKWGLPKGHAEDGESPGQTALREVREETGLTDLQLGEELVTIDWIFRASGRRIHKFTTFFLMYSEHGDPVPEAGEGISACQWVPLHVAHERISYDNASEVVKIAQRTVYATGSDEAAD